MPGVLLCEALAQAGGLLVKGSFRGGFDLDASSDDVFLVLTGLDNVKFRRQVVPGDQLRLEVTLQRRHRPLWKMHGVATVDGQLAAQADLSAVELDADRPRVVGAQPAPGTSIHPAAMIAREAELDVGVEIGAHAFIGPHVRMGAGRASSTTRTWTATPRSARTTRCSRSRASARSRRT